MIFSRLFFVFFFWFVFSFPLLPKFDFVQHPLKAEMNPNQLTIV